MATKRVTDFGRASTTLYTLAMIYDVGEQFLRAMGGESRSYSGLPRTFEEYVRRLYGTPERNWFLVLNYGFLVSLIAFLLVVVGLLVR